MKALVKWFDGIDIKIPFVSIKFKKPNKTSDSTLTNATGLNKANNYKKDDNNNVISFYIIGFIK